MTLIYLLIALGLDFFIGGLEQFRRFDWWNGFYYWCEKKAGQNNLWNGPVGVILLFILPVVVVIGLQVYFDYVSWLIEAVFTLLLLIYCLAPEKLDDQLDYYISSVEEDNDAEVQRLQGEIIQPSIVQGEIITEEDVIKSAFMDAHQRTFAVIFWFLLLGIVGAVLYRLVCSLGKELSESADGFSASLRDLQNILEWPSSRLLVLGMALAGHLMDAINRWIHVDGFSLNVNNEVLTEGGLGALQYQPEIDVPGRNKAYWIEELKSQLNRTLIIWLAIIAIMTLSGKLG